ncbi:MAG: tetratricopeptide repeat protein [Acidobacteriota bacterium]|nr:tetratricopeptide repeat protein [Acidobacteriota bacterium]
MAADSPRVLELRRRVQADPASITFAQLAEECRRAGDAAEAVDICRAGLAHHPGYLSARVTLGRALLEVGRLDEAAVELTTVVQAAPTNLPAIRGLAEIHQQRGDMAQALAHYQRALQLAQFDPDLEDSVERLSQVVAPAPVLAPPSPVKVEDLFDFDTLLRQLGETSSASADEVRYGASGGGPPVVPPMIAASAIDAVDLQQQPADAFADVERDLRERAELRAAEERAERERAERLAAEARAEREHAERVAAEARAEREHTERIAAEARAEREHEERMAAEKRAEREHAERMAAEERAEAERRAAEQRAAEARAAEARAAEERAAQQAARERAERFAAEEQAARDRVAQQAAEEQAARVRLAARRQAAVVADLEQWLGAIEADRQTRDTA